MRKGTGPGPFNAALVGRGAWGVERYLPPIGFVSDPPARSPTIQPQSATDFALIPDWLRFAPFLGPGTPLAAARCDQVRRLRSHQTCRRSLSPATQAATDHRQSPGPAVTFPRWVPEALAGRSPHHHTHSISLRIRHPPSGICDPLFLLPHSPFRIPHFLAEAETIDVRSVFIENRSDINCLWSRPSG
jgi:hypothetical protein